MGTARRTARERVRRIVFETDTPAGRVFDAVLLVIIALSIGVVMLESVAPIRARHGPALERLEWLFTGLFTLEYVLRLWSIERPLRYAKSFFGLVDLMALLPTYLSVFLPGGRSLLIIRVFRLLRVFRVLKLTHFLGEAHVLLAALRASRPKITVFLVFVGSTVVLVGALMYLIEGEAAGFDSIPRGMYWSIVTLTTVGFGDITPKTVSGQFLASVLMTLGYGVIAVPTGIVSVELANAVRRSGPQEACPDCALEGHEPDAVYCRRCGAHL